MMFKGSRSLEAQQAVDFDRYTFSKQQCDDLYEMILVDDDIHLEAHFPEKIHFDYTQTQLIQSFLICRQVWVEGILDTHFPKIIDQLCSSYQITSEEKAIYKMVRAKFKHLCYAYRVFDDRHKASLSLTIATALLGELQDGFKNEKMSIVRSRAYVLKFFWKDSRGLALLRRDVQRFFPCSLESFTSNLQKRIKFIHKQLDLHSAISASEFHSIRKQISMFAALYGTFDVLFPSPYHHQIFQAIATINGLMGSYHDELIEKKLNKTQNYFFDRFAMPDEILYRLQIFTEQFVKAEK